MVTSGGHSQRTAARSATAERRVNVPERRIGTFWSTGTGPNQRSDIGTQLHLWQWTETNVLTRS